MPKLRVAVIASIQDTNQFPDPQTGKTTDERVQMHKFAVQLIAMNALRSSYTGIEMMIFTDPSWKYSLDTSHLEHLHIQTQQACAWLDQGEAQGFKTLALNLHSDGVAFTHVGGYWDGAAPESEQVAKKLRGVLAPIFETAKLYGADYGAAGYVFATDMKHRHRPTLLEIGDHLVQSDNLIVATRGGEIAKAIVQGLVDFFQLPNEPSVGYTQYSQDKFGHPIGPEFAEFLNKKLLVDPKYPAPRLWVAVEETGDSYLYLVGMKILFLRAWLNEVREVWS